MYWLILLPLFFCSFQKIAIHPQEALSIAQRIWKNECKGSIDGLVSWNEGEEFASLGIGHFIWYPADKRGPFQEMFPPLLSFLESEGASLPEWLKKERACPWKTRGEFQKIPLDSRIKELRTFLSGTVALQAAFMAQRLERALPRMVEGQEARKKKHIEEQFYLVAKSPLGFYALIDYVNFKGEGTSPEERYKGSGWGLLQVLEEMPASTNKSPLEEFVAAAKNVLSRRVKNAPPERKEERWLPGWNNRLDTYLEKQK